MLVTGRVHDKDCTVEIRQLFEELQQTYQRSAAAAHNQGPPAGDQSPFVAESHKAAEIIAKIRALAEL